MKLNTCSQCKRPIEVDGARAAYMKDVCRTCGLANHAKACAQKLERIAAVLESGVIFKDVKPYPKWAKGKTVEVKSKGKPLDLEGCQLLILPRSVHKELFQAKAAVLVSKTSEGKWLRHTAALDGENDAEGRRVYTLTIREGLDLLEPKAFVDLREALAQGVYDVMRPFP